MRTPLAGALGAVVLGLLAGCAGSAGELVVELGTGEDRFEPLEDEAHLPLVAGPQGGHHLWLSLRVHGLSPGPAELAIDAVPLEATAPPPRRAPVRVHLQEPADGAGDYVELVGWPAQLADPECLVGVPLSVRVTVTDARGRQGTDERLVIPDASPLLGECAR